AAGLHGCQRNLPPPSQHVLRCGGPGNAGRGHGRAVGGHGHHDVKLHVAAAGLFGPAAKHVAKEQVHHGGQPDSEHQVADIPGLPGELDADVGGVHDAAPVSSINAASSVGAVISRSLAASGPSSMRAAASESGPVTWTRCPASLTDATRSRDSSASTA